MIGRSAAPRILAAAVIASSSIVSVGSGNGASGSATSARLAQVSSAHSSATGRGRPEVACQTACETRWRRLLRTPDALGPLGDVAHQAQLVVDLVQMAVAPVDVGLRDLADQADHRRVHAVGGEQRGAGIQQAGAGHHGEGLRLAGDEGRAQRHVGRRLFVARMDHAQPLGGVVEGVEQRIVVQAGQGVDRVEAMAQEGFDRGFGGRQTRHGVDVQTRPTAIKARGVRLILFALFLAGGAVLVVVLLSWFADRRLDRGCRAPVVCRGCQGARDGGGPGAGHGADRAGGRAQPLLRLSPRRRGGAVEGGQGEVLHRERQRPYEPDGDARRPDRARRAGERDLSRSDGLPHLGLGAARARRLRPEAAA